MPRANLAWQIFLFPVLKSIMFALHNSLLRGVGIAVYYPFFIIISCVPWEQYHSELLYNLYLYEFWEICLQRCVHVHAHAHDG